MVHFICSDWNLIWSWIHDRNSLNRDTCGNRKSCRCLTICTVERESVRVYALGISCFLRTICPPSLENIQIHQSCLQNLWIDSQRHRVIGNWLTAPPLENVGGIKWPWGPAIRRHWCKATIFSDQFSRRGPMNCHKSLARSYLTRGHLPWEDSIPLNFLWRILDTPKMMMARGGISNVNGKKGWELRDKSMWSL